MLRITNLSKSYGIEPVLAVAHDRAFIRRVATQVWELRAGRLRPRPDLEPSGVEA